MKKKLIDLTIKEIKNICEQHKDCYNCPILKLCNHCFYEQPNHFDLRAFNKVIDL